MCLGHLDHVNLGNHRPHQSIQFYAFGVLTVFPEVEAKPYPTLHSITENETYGVDIDKSCSHFDRDDLVHPNLIQSVNSSWREVTWHTGTAARTMKADAPAMNRNAMNSAISVLPQRTAPEMIASIELYGQCQSRAFDMTGNLQWQCPICAHIYRR